MARPGSRSLLAVLLVALYVLAPGLAAAGGGQEPVELSVWSYLAPDDPAVKAYIERFQEQNPTITVNYTAFPEDDYQDKVRTALSAGSPPDIAVIEDRRWMRAGLVEELTDEYAAWGIDPADFNPGGLARATPEGALDGGLYGVGDFLGGNVLFYNKAMFDEAGIPHPSATESLTWAEYAEICRALGKPSRNPAEAVWGCSVPAWGFDINDAWIYGPDGRTAVGHMDSDAVSDAWNIGTALVRDRFAPNAEVLGMFPAGESDAFAQGKLGITWSDFTEAAKYQANGIDFGLAPFMVIEGAESFVDTWTTPWGTFTQSAHPEEAMKFLQFIATDAQRIRAEISSDPPLSMALAEELEWGRGDPVKEQYLTVLQQAKPQVFVPELPEGAFDEDEVYRQMTVGGATDAAPILDAAAAATQPLLDEAWQEWERLGAGG